MPGKNKRRERSQHKARVRASGIPKKSRARSGAQYTYRAMSSIERGRLQKMPKRNPGWKRYATSYGVYKVKKQGNVWIVRSPDGSTFPYSSREAAMKHFAGYKKPARKNPTKAQKRLNASKRSKQKRVAVALKKYLQQQNPGTKLAGAKVEKLKGGVLKITPIKANRGVKR